MPSRVSELNSRVNFFGKKDSERSRKTLNLLNYQSRKVVKPESKSHVLLRNILDLEKKRAYSLNAVNEVLEKDR